MLGQARHDGGAEKEKGDGSDRRLHDDDFGKESSRILLES
jgi:hypothetical protein